MNVIAINQDLCKKCGVCSAICVDDVFEKAGSQKFPKVLAETNCIACGHCIAMCASGAIIHKKLRKENFTLLKGNTAINPDTLENFLRSKRSARHFKSLTVEREKIARLLRVGQQAPSDTNSQDRQYIVVTDKKKIDTLEGLVVQYYKRLLFWMKYPVRRFLGLFTPYLMKELERAIPDFTSMILKFDHGEKPVFRNAPCVIFIHANKGNPMGKDNCTIAQDYIMLEAEAMGLGTCVIGYATGATGAINKYLNIPRDQKINCAIIVGYPEYSYARSVDRNDAKVCWL